MSPLLPSRASLLFVLQLVSLLLHDATAEWAQNAKLTDSDGEEDDFFGFSVAIDNGILVVGAHLDDIGIAIQAGSATIFELSNHGEWVAQQKLTASDADRDDRFGFSVAISNGIVALGAPDDDDGGDAAGAVYIYEKGADGVWTERQKLIPSGAMEGDWFGCSLAMQGSTLVVGESSDDTFRGAAHVYTLVNSTWTQVATLTASDGRSSDLFGFSVAIDLDTIVVGALQDDNLGRYSGSAYVFQRDGQSGSWTQVAKLTPADGQSLDEFGRAVALEGGTIFVSSYNNADGEQVGAVYLFGKEGGGTWTQQNKLVARDFATYDRFGYGIAVRDDNLVVGANGQNNSTGTVHVFQKVSGVWVERAKLAASDGATLDSFGWSVAVDDRMVVVGALGDNSFQGSVYAFEWRASETDVRPSAAPEAPTSSTATPTSASASSPSSVTEAPTSSTLTPTRTSSPNFKSASRSAVVDPVIYIGVGGGGVLLSAVLLFCF